MYVSCSLLQLLQQLQLASRSGCTFEADTIIFGRKQNRTAPMDEEAISWAQSSFGSSLVAQGNGPCTKLDHVTICDFSLHTLVNNTTFIIAMDPRSYWWTSLFYTEPYAGQWILGVLSFVLKISSAMRHLSQHQIIVLSNRGRTDRSIRMFGSVR